MNSMNAINAKNSNNANNAINGVINLYKPPDITSHKAVKKVQGILGAKKAGHAGTLDPFAEGVLLVCINSATRIVEFLIDLKKEYIVEIQLGIETDTFDITGNTVNEKDPSHVTEEQLIDVFSNFRGEILQTPPVYSAIKKGGVPLYKLARKGITVEPEPRRVYIEELKLLNFNTPYVIISVKCSKGTYVRSLVNDIGRQLEVGAVVKSLKRTAVGNFRAEESVSLSELEAGNYRIYTIDEVLSFIPSLTLDELQSRMASHGNGFYIKEKYHKGRYRLKGPDGLLLGIGKINDNQYLKIEKIFGDNIKH